VSNLLLQRLVLCLLNAFVQFCTIITAISDFFKSIPNKFKKEDSNAND